MCTDSATLIAESDHAARKRTRGLVGARQIVEQHGGTLRVSSILGQSTRFGVSLRLAFRIEDHGS